MVYCGSNGEILGEGTVAVVKKKSRYFVLLLKLQEQSVFILKCVCVCVGGGDKMDGTGLLSITLSLIFGSHQLMWHGEQVHGSNSRPRVDLQTRNCC